MSETPTQDPQDAPGPAPEPTDAPLGTPEPQDPALEDENEKPAAPWYRRPVPIVLLVVLVLVLAVLIPPVVADEVPVGLDDEGEQNADQGGWEVEQGNEDVTAVAGLVLVSPKTLIRENEAGFRDGVYIYTTVKIPAMLPQGFVADRLRDNALERLDERGVDVDFETHSQEPYDGNGHDATVDYYTGIAERDGFFLGDTKVDLFIATWRCSVLGSYAVVVGAAGHEDDGDEDDPLSGFDTSQAGGITRLQAIQDELLAHTKCEG